MLRADREDLTRAAGLLLRHEAEKEPEYASVAMALYGNQPDLPASYLARHIAALAAVMPSRLAIATTNFDDILETSLAESFPEVVTCSLESADRWWEAFFAPNEPVFHVLHLHGALGRQGTGDRVYPPLVLTEDAFNRFGKQVQDEVARILEESSAVIAVGLSLTDPNLIGPLSERAHAENEGVFMVSVPTAHRELDAAEALEYAEVRERYLTESFGIQIVPLNSYSQMHQLFIELEIAISTAEKYFASSPATGTRYGFRLNRCLRAAYKSLGYSPTAKKPSQQALRKASDQLYLLLPGVRSELGRLVRKSTDRRSSILLKSCERIRDHIDDEGLGLFLWLPRRFDPLEEDTQRRHELQLVAASAYSHREQWSFERTVEVSAYGEVTAQRAAFTGQPIFEDADQVYEPRVWLSNAAVPLTLYDKQTDSVVTAGVVVLSSNKPMLQGGVYEPELITQSAVMSILPLSDQIELARYLAEATGRLLGSAP